MCFIIDEPNTFSVQFISQIKSLIKNHIRTCKSTRCLHNRFASCVLSARNFIYNLFESLMSWIFLQATLYLTFFIDFHLIELNDIENAGECSRLVLSFQSTFLWTPGSRWLRPCPCRKGQMCSWETLLMETSKQSKAKEDLRPFS